MIVVLLLTGTCRVALAQTSDQDTSTHTRMLRQAQSDWFQPRRYDAAGSPDTLGYAKPRSFQFISQVPDDLWQLARSPFQKPCLTGVLMTSAATISLMAMDQPFVNAVQSFGERNHISAIESNHILWSVKINGKTTKLLSVPGNLSTGLYQLGEGFPSLLLGGGLWIYGKIAHDNRSLSTASQLAENFIVMGIGTQVLKRIAGRQTPGQATTPGGRWRPFPSFKNFQRHTPSYDAFPSGHLATLMSTVTLLAENYPEHRYIAPVGYSVIGLVGLAMMNNGVHWAGDYPLAIALGYVSARIVSFKYHHRATHPTPWYSDDP